MINEERVTQLLTYLRAREDESARFACQRLEHMLAQLRGGGALGAADQAWLDVEWERFSSEREPRDKQQRRGQYFGETL